MPIPERPKDWKPRDAPDFVRFYMGEDRLALLILLRKISINLGSS